MVRTIDDLRKATDAELIQEHDAKAMNTVPGVNYYLEELHRREMRASGDRMEAMTRHVEQLTHRIYALTIVITGMTALSVIAAVIAVYSS